MSELGAFRYSLEESSEFKQLMRMKRDGSTVRIEYKHDAENLIIKM